MSEQVQTISEEEKVEIIRSTIEEDGEGGFNLIAMTVKSSSDSVKAKQTCFDIFRKIAKDDETLSSYMKSLEDALAKQ
jgi:hypothetical protein